MVRSQVLTGTILAVAAVTIAGAAVGAPTGDEEDANLRAELKRISQMRIFFGHQSVGENLLDGIRQLSAEAGIALRIVELPNAGAVAPATIGHVFIGENRKPFGKIDAFEKAMGARPSGVDVALMKFCYLDIDESTDVKALFGRYRSLVENVKARNPATIIVHVTAPLSEVQGGTKAFLKRLLGRAPYGTIENVRRQEYNMLLRGTYDGKEPIFDLARLESTIPDGTVVTVEWKGATVPALAPLYTDDGGHLNAVGRTRAAREFVSVLASTSPSLLSRDQSVR